MVRKNVLIIDDSATDYLMMKSILMKTNESYKITHNVDGLMIIDLIVKETIDIVILDLLIDTILGIDILKEIKSNRLTLIYQLLSVHQLMIKV